MKTVGAILYTFTFLLAAAPAFADAISVNGTCEVGACANPGVLGTNTQSSTPFDFVYQFSNSDLFRLAGTLSVSQTQNGGSYSDRLFVTNFSVTFLGNSTGTTSANDTLSASFLQNYAAEPAGNVPFTDELSGTFGSGLGNASSASGTFVVDGNTLNTLGPVSPPPGSFDLTGSGRYSVTSGIQNLDFTYTLDFGAGSETGSEITLYPIAAPPSVTPEPSGLALLGTGIMAIGGVVRKRTAAK